MILSSKNMRIKNKLQQQNGWICFFDSFPFSAPQPDIIIRYFKWPHVNITALLANKTQTFSLFFKIYGNFPLKFGNKTTFAGAFARGKSRKSLYNKLFPFLRIVAQSDLYFHRRQTSYKFNQIPIIVISPFYVLNQNSTTLNFFLSSL